MRAPGIGGVILESDGRGGAAEGRGGTGVADLGTAGCEMRGVSADDLEPASAGRGVLITTPGVKVGVGFRRCGGDVNGSRYGTAGIESDGRGAAGAAEAAGAIGAAGAAGATGAAGGAGAAGGLTGVTGRAAAGVAARTGVGMSRAGCGVGTGVRSRAGASDGGSKLNGAAAASDSIIARRAAASEAGLATPPGSVAPTGCGAIPMCITAPQTEQRARTPSAGTFAGSTRNTDWHSPHETFTAPPSPARATPV